MEVGMKSSEKIAYNQFYELIESKKSYLFYLDEKYVSCVKKSEISNLEEFSAFLKKAFGCKYRKI